MKSKYLIFISLLIFKSYSNLINVNFDRLFPYSCIELIERTNKNTFNLICNYNKSKKSLMDKDDFTENIFDNLIELNYLLKDCKDKHNELLPIDVNIALENVYNNFFLFNTQSTNLNFEDTYLIRTMFLKAIRKIENIKKHNPIQEIHHSL